MSIEGAHRTALVNDGEPVGVRLARGKGAITEVGEGRLEADHRPWRSFAIGAMAGYASGAVHLLGSSPKGRAARRC